MLIASLPRSAARSPSRGRAARDGRGSGGRRPARLEGLRDGLEDAHAGVVLVVRLDEGPRGLRRVGAVEHVLDRLDVDVPLLAVAPVLVRELPRRQRILGALVEPALLLGLVDV